MESIHPRAAPDSDISAFWNWFLGVAPELSANLDNAVVLGELDSRVAELGDVSWEVGPGCREENALVITPDGSKEWLTTTQHIVELAPPIPSWEIHATRPPRAWDLRFSIESVAGGMIEVDARQWRYVLFKFPDGTFDIVIEQVGFTGVSEGDRYTAAVVLVDGVIGERRRLEIIETIEPVEALSEEDAKKASLVNVLPEHLDSLQKI